MGLAQGDTVMPVAITHDGGADFTPPLVSIVTPSYNQGGFIRETIASVLAQSYTNIELWVIDGGSHDETVAVLREFEHDPRFHWISERDGGQSDAINKGLALCRGELFAWLNADDRLLPGALAQIVAGWQAGARPAIVYGRARLIDWQSRDLGYCPAQSSRMTLEQILNLRCFLAQPATFVPTAAVRQLGGVDLDLHYAMDLDLWVKLAEQLPIRHVPCDLAEFRLHPGSKTVALSTRFIADVANVLERAAARGLLPLGKARARSHIFAARAYLTPEVNDFVAALRALKLACYSEPKVLPEAMFVLSKALIRQMIGERFWSWVRLIQVRLS